MRNIAKSALSDKVSYQTSLTAFRSHAWNIFRRPNECSGWQHLYVCSSSNRAAAVQGTKKTLGLFWPTFVTGHSDIGISFNQSQRRLLFWMQSSWSRTARHLPFKTHLSRIFAIARSREFCAVPFQTTITTILLSAIEVFFENYFDWITHTKLEKIDLNFDSEKTISFHVPATKVQAAVMETPTRGQERNLIEALSSKNKKP